MVQTPIIAPGVMLPHGSNAPQRVEHSRSGAILPMVSILSQARRRERASPMTPPRRCQGPSPDQRIVPYSARLQSGTPRQGPYGGRSHGGPPRGYSPSSGRCGLSRHTRPDAYRLLPIKREIRLWDKPATPSMIAARAWAQASEDSPQPASKQHHRYTTMLVAHDTVGLRQRCPFSGCRIQSSPQRPVQPTCTRLSPTRHPNRSGVFDGREKYPQSPSSWHPSSRHSPPRRGRRPRGPPRPRRLLPLLAHQRPVDA